MAPWYAVNMNHRPPDNLLSLAKPIEPLSVPVIATAKSAALSAPPVADIEPRDFSNIQPLDLAKNVEALRRTHAINQLLLEEAMKGSEQNQITLRQKNYESSFDLLRLAEQTLVKVQKEKGDLIDKGEVQIELAQFGEALKLMRQAMPARVVSELEKIVPRRIQRILRVLQPHLIISLERVRDNEEQIFRSLETLGSPAAVTGLLV